ncbi:alpha/beta fold hydrolase [Angustibacter peucedani]
MLLTLLAAACTSGPSATSRAGPVGGLGGGPTGSTSGPLPVEAWSGWGPCPASAPVGDLACGSLVVPVDRALPRGRTLRLPVVAGGALDADRTLLFLTGGPGQPGVPFVARTVPQLGRAADSYRVVMLDQRGTGANALVCPQLQQQVGYSDLEVPTTAAVDECADTLGGDRAHYGTTDTVADLDDLRRALGLARWSIDGVSYGTYVAQRYAAAYPYRVDKLVLDSVVPVDGFSATNVESFADVASVLRAVCRAQHCPDDPAADLHAVVQRYGLGPQLLDVISLLSVVDPTFADLPRRLYEARQGRPAALQGFLDAWQNGSAGRADQLSQGLHAATICLDLQFPWGGAASDPAVRAVAANRAVARIPASALFPFDARTARSNGEMTTCERWPRTADPVVPLGSMTAVQALLLHGARDLSTPLVWARRAQADLPGSRLVVVPDAGHSVQSRDAGDARAQVERFLLAP